MVPFPPCSRYAGAAITHVVAIESRGFMVAAPLALALKCAFVPIRRARYAIYSVFVLSCLCVCV